MAIFCGPAKIINNEEVAPGVFHAMLDCPEVAERATPGQFLHIRCSDALSPLLRRPISIAMAEGRQGTVEILYRAVGAGTRLMARKRRGDVLDIMGPLGHGFPLPHSAKYPVLVGGGMGMAPLLFLAKNILDSRKSSKKSESPGSRDALKMLHSPYTGIVLAGFSTAGDVFGLDFMKDCGFKVEVCTDDGTCGYKGFPTDLLEKYLNPVDIIYACGPAPMLAKVKTLAERAGIPAYVSLEERMACGVGACLGCAVKAAGGGFLKVCKDGPVFDTSSVDI